MRRVLVILVALLLPGLASVRAGEEQAPMRNLTVGVMGRNTGGGPSFDLGSLPASDGPVLGGFGYKAVERTVVYLDTVDGAGLAWTEIYEPGHRGAGGVAFWMGIGTVDPSEPITVTFSGPLTDARLGWSFDEAPGVVSPPLQAVISPMSDGTRKDVTLSPFERSTNWTYGFAMVGRGGSEGEITWDANIEALGVATGPRLNIASGWSAGEEAVIGASWPRAASNVVVGMELDTQSGPDPEPTPSPDPGAAADLQASFEAAPGAGEVGSEVTYVVSVTNAGPDVASAVEVTVALPLVLAAGWATPTQGACGSPAERGDPIICELGVFAEGQAASIELRTIPIEAGPVEVEATASAAEADPVAENDSAVTSTLVDGVSCTAIGTPGDDELWGGAGEEVLCGLWGHDAIRAGGGNDVVYGGPGNDTIAGNAGNDELLGANDSDRIVGQAGDDLLFGGPGGDSLDSRDTVGGNDSLDGGPEGDVCRTDPGDLVTNCP